jgi:hypothetical protein
MQYRPVLGGVDVFAGEHGVAAALEVGGLCQLDQQLQRLAGHPVLAVVDVQIADRQHQLASAGRVFVEELTEMFAPDLVVVAEQGVPRGSRGDVGNLLGRHMSTLVRQGFRRSK